MAFFVFFFGLASCHARHTLIHYELRGHFYDVIVMRSIALHNDDVIKRATQLIVYQGGKTAVAQQASKEVETSLASDFSPLQLSYGMIRQTTHDSSHLSRFFAHSDWSKKMQSDWSCVT